MLEIIGSKKKMRQFYGISQLFHNSPNYNIQCQNYLNGHNITIDHIDLIVSLKKDGNRAAHADRPTLKKQEKFINLNVG